jgi:hypothetical protein
VKRDRTPGGVVAMTGGDGMTPSSHVSRTIPANMVINSYIAAMNR